MQMQQSTEQFSRSDAFEFAIHEKEINTHKASILRAISKGQDFSFKAKSKISNSPLYHFVSRIFLSQWLRLT